MKTTWILLAGLLLWAGCDTTSTANKETTAISQRILFEVEHINYAWIPTWLGFYVDNEGQVFSYDIGDGAWDPANEATYTEAELLEKYDHQKKLIGQVDQETLLQQVALIQDASTGELTKPENRCADAGANTFRAFLYDESAERYTPVLLQQEGDFIQQNLSEDAQALSTWLKSLVEGYDNAFCTP